MATIGGVGALRSNNRPNVKVAMPQIFNGKAGKILEFLIAYRLYIRMKMREALVKEQVQ